MKTPNLLMNNVYSNSRVIACNLLYQVIAQQQNFTIVLDHYKKNHPTDKYRFDPIVPAICFGVLRLYHQLKFITNLLLEKPLKAKQNKLFILILIGIYQLLDMRVPEHAAIFETVNAAKILKYNWATGLINSLLRNFSKNKSLWLAKVKDNQAAFYSHPKWLIKLLQSYYPNHWQQLLQAHNQKPAQALRVNQQKITRNAYLSLLKKANISAKVLIPSQNSIICQQGITCQYDITCQHGIVLSQPQEVENLPYFADGYVSVQDGAAQLAAKLLNLQPNLKVLDACAAPGGKTCHLLETEPSINCTAIDIAKSRCELIQQNLARCQLQAHVITADAADVSSWWDQVLFDRILLDAPCSTTGVIRRHPDIKILRKKADIPLLQQHQEKLLTALWPLLKPGGLLLYATCSILPEENSLQVENFLERYQDAGLIKELQILPVSVSSGASNIDSSMDNSGANDSYLDGFYYALIKKF